VNLVFPLLIGHRLPLLILSYSSGRRRIRIGCRCRFGGFANWERGVCRYLSTASWAILLLLKPLSEAVEMKNVSAVKLLGLTHSHFISANDAHAVAGNQFFLRCI